MNKFGIANKNERFFCTLTLLESAAIPGARFICRAFGPLSISYKGNLICSDGSSGGSREKQPEWKGGGGFPHPH